MHHLTCTVLSFQRTSTCPITTTSRVSTIMNHFHQPPCLSYLILRAHPHAHRMISIHLWSLTSSLASPSVDESEGTIALALPIGYQAVCVHALRALSRPRIADARAGSLSFVKPYRRLHRRSVLTTMAVLVVSNVLHPPVIETYSAACMSRTIVALYSMVSQVIPARIAHDVPHMRSQYAYYLSPYPMSPFVLSHHRHSVLYSATQLFVFSRTVHHHAIDYWSCF